MKDYLKQEIHVDDIVLYPSTSRSNHCFIKGKVIGFTKTKVKVEIIGRPSYEISEGDITLKDSSKIIVLEHAINKDVIYIEVSNITKNRGRLIFDPLKANTFRKYVSAQIVEELLEKLKVVCGNDSMRFVDKQIKYIEEL